MRGIKERTVLLRASAETPEGLKLAISEGRQGWNFLRAGDAQRLARKVKARKWQFVALLDRLTASGIGKTAPKARGCALDRALGRIDGQVNAVEVVRIQATSYPFFCLARITLSLSRAAGCHRAGERGQRNSAAIARQARSRRLTARDCGKCPWSRSAHTDCDAIAGASKGDHRWTSQRYGPALELTTSQGRGRRAFARCSSR